MNKNQRLAAAWIWSIGLLALLLIAACVFPQPTPFQQSVTRFLAACLGAVFSGFLLGNVKFHGRVFTLTVSGTGGFFVFILLMVFVDPLRVQESVKSVVKTIAVKIDVAVSYVVGGREPDPGSKPNSGVEPKPHAPEPSSDVPEQPPEDRAQEPDPHYPRPADQERKSARGADDAVQEGISKKDPGLPGNSGPVGAPLDCEVSFAGGTARVDDTKNLRHELALSFSIENLCPNPVRVFLLSGASISIDGGEPAPILPSGISGTARATPPRNAKWNRTPPRSCRPERGRRD